MVGFQWEVRVDLESEWVLGLWIIFDFLGCYDIYF